MTQTLRQANDFCHGVDPWCEIFITCHPLPDVLSRKGQSISTAEKNFAAMFETFELLRKRRYLSS